jgi:hypothetical protein
VKDINDGRVRVLIPENVEELMVATGIKSEHDNLVEIILSTELMVDLCLRVIKLEDKENDYGDGEEYEW